VTKKLSPGPDTGNSRDPGIPSPVWPHVHITNSGEHVSRAGDHVTRIHLNNDTPGHDQQDRVPVILRPGVHFNTSAGYNEEETGRDHDRDTRQQDSIVTHSLLMMMNNTMTVSGTSGSSSITKPRSTSDQPDSPTGAKQSSGGVTKAFNNARRSFRNVNRSLRNSSRKIARRGKSRKGTAGSGGGGSKSGSLRSAGSVEAVRELWSKTGMRTNGRKLLIEPSKSDNDFVNDAFESDDNSQVSVPRERVNRNFPKERQETRRQTSSSSSSSEDIARTRHKVLRAKQDAANADQIHVEKIENMDRNIVNPSKHVRFNHNNFTHTALRNNAREDRNVLWDKYYGATDPALLEAGLASNFTIDLTRNRALKKTEKRRKNLHCCCKISCFLILLVSFLLVIITVTFFLTKGKKYFGAL